MKTEHVFAAIEAIEPPIPPCFESRDNWHSYLIASFVDLVRSYREADAPVISGESPHTARINPRFFFCGECTDEYRMQMYASGRCKPNFLFESLATHPAGRKVFDLRVVA